MSRSRKRPHAALGLVHHDALGDLELEGRRIETRLGQDRVDLIEEIGLGELAGGQVDRHHQRRPARSRVAPSPRLAAGRLEDPPAERHDQAGLLGQRDERERRDQAAIGMLPADERLEPDDPVGRQVDQRLVVDTQLAALEARRRSFSRSMRSIVWSRHRRFEQDVARDGSAFARTIAISASRSISRASLDPAARWRSPATR